jgi:hypothetical protein
MESTSKEGDKGKWPTKVSGSVRRAKVVENPPKKRSQKRPAEAIRLLVPSPRLLRLLALSLRLLVMVSLLRLIVSLMLWMREG